MVPQLFIRVDTTRIGSDLSTSLWNYAVRNKLCYCNLVASSDNSKKLCVVGCSLLVDTCER